ncbi:UNVERIFIED_CONTAM: hypothetical protein K2H54_049147 [Gekko kuhli]
MKRGGARKGAASGSRSLSTSRDRLTLDFRAWQDWLCDTCGEGVAVPICINGLGECTECDFNLLRYSITHDWIPADITVCMLAIAQVTVKETGLCITRADNKIWLTLLMAAVSGILHWYHITTLFENNSHFSHLSTLEREMVFRTEMGLYYSYFKTIIEAPSFSKGLLMIMNDNITEYPLVINTLKRFNLYPEVLLAFWYRMYTGMMNVIGISTKSCWIVNRGEDVSPVESCEGLGDPASFYVAVIFLLNGLLVSVFFIYGTYLSGSRFGGLLTVACYFFNHGESTRVMWTPPLRESFSYPFLVVQMLLLTYILSHNVEDCLLSKEEDYLLS